ncbi:hypothetical protein MNB_SV-8-1395 [hydrothermal vent metagenome]|uniref:Lipoprotein n=1 Tax=hydrothermal vent metagenome TaxID=652676 RepID=A0A1W1BHE0_9ZZZZ
MIKKLAIVTMMGFVFTGCTNSLGSLTPSTSKSPINANAYKKAAPAKQTAYSNTMRKVASGIKNDPNYNRIALDTPEKKSWFRNLTYRLWDRQINKYQFVAEGLKKYPTHKYEFEFVVRGFNS